MPNVMGREFPYTAEGMAAAQQYSQAMGMRDGGSMGFRPIGMQAGGVIDYLKGVFNGPVRSENGADESTNIVRGLYDLMSRGTTDQVRNYIEANRADLQMISKDPNPMFNMLRSVLPDFPPTQLPDFPPTPPPTEGTMQPMQEGAPEDVGNLGRMGSAFGDSSISNYDMASNFLSPDDPALFAPRDPRRGVAVANRIQDDIEAGIPTRGSADGPDLTGAELLSRLSPEEQALFIQQRNSAPVEMNRGGIMSLRGY